MRRTSQWWTVDVYVRDHTAMEALFRGAPRRGARIELVGSQAELTDPRVGHVVRLRVWAADGAESGRRAEEWISHLVVTKAEIDVVGLERRLPESPIAPASTSHATAAQLALVVVAGLLLPALEVLSGPVLVLAAVVLAVAIRHAFALWMATATGVPLSPAMWFPLLGERIAHARALTAGQAAGIAAGGAAGWALACSAAVVAHFLGAGDPRVTAIGLAISFFNCLPFATWPTDGGRTARALRDVPPEKRGGIKLLWGIAVAMTAAGTVAAVLL